MNDQELWQAVLGELEVLLSKASFTTWFKNTFVLKRENGELTIAVPTSFHQKWFQDKYATQITETLQKYLPDLSKVTFEVATRQSAPQEITRPVIEERLPTVNLSPATPHQEPDDTLSPRYTFDSFVVGNSNRLAHAASVAVAQSPGTLHNPLFVYGGVGLGKTHLVHAVGHEIRRRHPKKRVLYVDCEQFTSEFIQALRSNTMDKFKKKYRDVDVFLVDDIQFLSAKEGTQEEFFHTFNALHTKSRQIVLTSDRVPNAIPQLELRLSSRFGWGLVADILPPNFEMRVAILRNKANEKQFAIHDEVVSYLAERVSSNIRELEGVLNRLQGWCQLNGIAPSVEVAQEMMTGFLGKRDLARVSAPQVLAVVGHYYKIPLEDLVSSRRTADLVLPRQVAMYLLRAELGLSYPRIGQEMGGKDHTTVMHGVARVEKEKGENSKVRDELSALKEHLYAVR